MALALSVALLTGILFMVAGCGGTQPTGVDATPILQAAVEPMKALKSFHFTYEVVKPKNAKPVQGAEIVKVVGDVTLEGNMKATIDLQSNGVPFQLGFVQAGDKYYVQDPTSQKWQSGPAQDSPLGKVNLNAGTVAILQKVTDPKQVGKETIDGVPCYKITGSVAAQEVAAIAGVVTTSEDFAVTLWIGQTDHLVHRIEIVGAASADEDPKTLRVITLSNFDEPVTIEPPN
jgi:hypothetical protein